MATSQKPQPQHRKTQLVMVAIDASDISEQAFKFYLNTLHHPGNELLFVHVAEPPHVGTSLGVSSYSFVSGTIYGEMITQRRLEVASLCDYYENLMKGKNIKYKIHTVEFGGNPGEAMVKIAKEKKVNLIVIGTRGLGKIRRTVLGSVSDYIVHHSHCPIMVCNEKSDKPQKPKKTK